jgi:hypothetical protein
MFKLLEGLVTPLRISCKALLSQELKNYGVDALGIPPLGCKIS